MTALHWTMQMAVREAALARALGISHDGVTDIPARRERVRALILERQLADMCCQTGEFRASTYAQAFQATYKEPLQCAAA